jgi:predicted AlkP superfamily phosphohydrolase/phosphomutase/tetratricopeptide (TPR) repeat protein
MTETKTDSIPLPNDRKVLVIGWDAADWRAIRPLLEQGKMPNLQRMMDEGVHGNNATLTPVLSPMLWTSIATGKRPFKHGIHGFSEPTPDGKGIRPITNVSRKVKAVWNILNQCGKKPIVVGWWPSHPAEPVDGVMVSDWYQKSRPIRDPEVAKQVEEGVRPKPGEFGWTLEQWPMPPGTVHPPRLERNLQEFRLHQIEVAEDDIGPFVPNGHKVDQEKDQRLQSLAKIIGEISSIHAAATALMQLEPWDFMAVYLDGIDHFCHGFMKYHPPRQKGVSEEDFEVYSGVVEAGYRMHDLMLGAMLELAGKDTTVILLSDHGFHPDHLRPEHIPVEPAGPAIEHRTYGIFVAKGPGIRQGGEIAGASVLDLCPTILSLYGLPVGRDMDGKPLVTIFEDPPEVASIESWEEVPGEAGIHPPDAMLDSVQSAEAMKQLVELGYIEEPNEDTGVAVKETVRELRYNLAQSYMDAGRLAEAAEILEEIWNDFPDEHRFGLNLLGCLAGLGRWEDHAAATAKLAQNVVAAREKALEELETLRPEAEKHDLKIPRLRQREGEIEVDETAEPAADAGEKAPEAEDGEKKPYKEPPRALVFKIRKLMSLLGDMRGTFAWLEAQQAIGTGAGERSLPMLEVAFAECADDATPDRNLMLARAFLSMSRREQAETCFARALDADSENADARLGLAECAVARESWEDAIEHALTATELRFQNPRAHHLLGKALHATGDGGTAKAALELAVAQAPGYVEARESLAALLETLGDAEGAANQRRIVEDLAKRAESATGAAADELDAAMDSIAADRAKRREGADRLGSLGDVSRDEIVTIVSGLPRSGTSMMMQAIAAGGLSPFTDEKREADSDNPRGYYEHEKATQLARDASWIPEAKARVVKIVAQLLSFLPRGPQTPKYRVVFMDRDLREIVKSQRAMLDRLGKSGGKLEPAKMMKTLDAQVAQIERWMRQRPDVECLFVDYAKVLADPRGEMAKVAAFLGAADAEAMAAAIDPSLRRQRGEAGT